jgi:hypothetical protein
MTDANLPRIAGPTPTVDRPPPGWHVLDVMRITSRRRLDWVALMISVHPDELQYRRGWSAWVRVPGKHRSRDDAWDAFEEMLATRH